MTYILISLLSATLLMAAETIPQSHFTLLLSKHQAYVGEPVEATLSLTQDHGTAQITKMHFPTLKAEGFRILPAAQHKAGSRSRRYILLPQRPGNMTLPPQSIEIAHKDPATYRNIWQTLKTIPVTLTVLPLPGGIHTAGNYRITSHIDHHTVQVNRPVNLTVTIEGKGSLQGMQALHLPLSEALVFEGKAEIRSEIAEGVYRSVSTQTFSIITDSSYTLPTLTWTYLNTDTGLTETLSTPSYPIEIQTTLTKNRLLRDTLLVLAGLFSGILLLWVPQKMRQRNIPRSDLYRRITKAKSDQALYSLLLPYADIGAMAEVLKKLDENLRGETTHALDRREIAKMLEPPYGRPPDITKG